MLYICKTDMCINWPYVTKLDSSQCWSLQLISVLEGKLALARTELAYSLIIFSK